MSALFIILVSLTMTLFSEKVHISNRCISGLMLNLIKKSWTDSIANHLLQIIVIFISRQYWTKLNIVEPCRPSSLMRRQIQDFSSQWSVFFCKYYLYSLEYTLNVLFKFLYFPKGDNGASNLFIFQIHQKQNLLKTYSLHW